MPEVSVIRFVVRVCCLLKAFGTASDDAYLCGLDIMPVTLRECRNDALHSCLQPANETWCVCLGACGREPRVQAGHASKAVIWPFELLVEYLCAFGGEEGEVILR